MKWINKGHEFDEVGKKFKIKEKLWIYGAGENGKDLFSRLGFADCVEGFIDNAPHKINTLFCGKPVISYEEFLECEEKQKVIISISAVGTAGVMKTFLLNGYQEGKDVFDYHIFVTFYLPIYAWYAWGKVCPLTMGCVMTTVCNLNCVGCMNFTNMNSHLRHYDIQQLKENFDLLFKHIDYIGFLQLTGGEPFLYPDFDVIVKYVNEKYRNRIGTFCIATNGTIVPGEKLLDSMKLANMTVYVDDYTENVEMARKNREQIIKTLNEHCITIIDNKVGRWLDFWKFQNLTDEKQLIKKCVTCEVPFVSVKNGKLFGCNYTEYMTEAGGNVENESDYLDLKKEIQKEILMEFCLGYSDNGYYSFCGKCAGFHSNNPNKLPVAQQSMKKDLY
ncbi:MAG: radical SAM protein [Lachnospiraceae bacterium]|nr:radical SAM protein [Lachnospiraceae bacterium]